MTLTCIGCETEFARPGKRGPVPNFCTTACKARWVRRTNPEIRTYARNYRRRQRMLGRTRDYEFEYNRRPEVKARQRERMRIRWYTDPEYRARQLARWRDRYPGLVPPAPYTGHRWLQMAHDAVIRDLDPTSPRAELYWDDMGEALLALLEGRDMKEAVQEYRRREYIPRHRTLHIGEWGDDEDEQNRWFESVLPTSPSAEDEALAREAVGLYVKTPYHHGRNGRPMRNRQSRPSNRRSNRPGGLGRHRR